MYDKIIKGGTLMKNKFIIAVLCFCIVLTGCNKEKNNGDGTVKKIEINIVEPLLLTKKIVVENSRTNKKIKEITDTNDIDKLLNILTNSYSTDEVVTTESSSWYLFLYDYDNKLISKIWVWESGYFGFINDKEYTFFEKSEDLQEIINK